MSSNTASLAACTCSSKGMQPRSASQHGEPVETIFSERVVGCVQPGLAELCRLCTMPWMQWQLGEQCCAQCHSCLRTQSYLLCTVSHVLLQRRCCCLQRV
jgi:hypothetical protein